MTRPIAFIARLMLVLAPLTSAPATALPQIPADKFAALAETARAEMRESATPGAAIALVKDDQIVYAQGFGVADVETRAPASVDMLFRLGSTTKMFTAAAVASLVVEGRMTLDAPASRYEPRLDPAIGRLTLEQLLTHTAGLRDEAPMFGRQDESALGDQARAMNGSWLFTKPGDVYSYSNPGFWMAGYLGEASSGQAYADLLAERIFKPVGMTRSTLRPTVAMTYPLAQGHERDKSGAPVILRPAANNAASWPAGSIFSSARELGRWVTAFVNGGRIDGQQALAPGVPALLARPRVPIPGRDAHYGLGLTIDSYRGHRRVGHGGSRAGYGSTIHMLPDDRAGVVVVANRTGSGLPKTAIAALDLLLGLPVDAPTPPARHRLPPGDVSRYAGRYTQDEANRIDLVARDGRLWLEDGERKLRVSLLEGTRLVAGDHEPDAIELVMILDAAGAPAYVHRGGRAFRRR